MPLPPIAIESTVDACVRTLKRAILSQELAIGERLAPERELAGVLGVSRNTLRAAISRLEQERLLSVRHGIGIVVLDPAVEGGPELIVALAAQGGAHGFAADLLLVRRSLARAVLESLPASPDEVAIAAMSAAIDRLEEGVALPAEQFAALDIEVARALVAATGRLGLRLCMNPVLAVLPQIPALCRAMFRDPPSHVQGWRSVRDWLRHPDPSAVEALIGLLEVRDATTLRHLGG